MELNLTDDGTRVNPPSVWSTGNKSDQHLVEVSTNKLFYKRKPSLRKLKLTLLLASIVLLTLCAIVVFLGINYSKVNEELTELKSICRSPECIRSASSILLSMNKSVDPCEDFYEYACGRWHEEHPVQSTFVNNDWFNERTQVVLAKIKDFLQKNSSDSEAYPTTQAKIMYEACIDTDRIEDLGLDPLTDVLSDMSLPLIMPFQEADYDLDLNINNLIAWILTTTGKDMILHTSVIPDVVNRTRNVITVGPPDPHSILPEYNVYKRKTHFPPDYHLRKQLVNDDKSGVIRPWRRYFSGIFKYFLKKSNVTNVSDEAVGNATYTLLEIYLQIQLVINNENITTPNDPHPTMMTLSELQAVTDEAAESVNLTSKINWQQYMESLFENSNSTIDYENDQLAVYTLEYYKAVSKVLANHSDYEIVLYLWSEVVSALIPYSNEDLQALRHNFLASFGEPTALPREAHCTTALWEVMDKAIAVGLIEDANIEHIREDVGTMINNIEFSLTKFIGKADWIDSETRAAIIDKAKNIKRYIGYPDWMLKTEELEDYYAGLNVSEETHMYNFINLAQIIIKGNLDQLNVENDYSDADFDPLEVNAQYIPTANSINIPLGILQFPFYNLGIDALNYGAVGVIIGHELTHAFDNTGREYDKVGNVKEWWTNDTTENYLGRVECFIDHYNSYVIDEIEESVNGNLTLSENIADNGGVKDAFHGFQKLKEDEDYKELKLPGLEEFSSDKLFYLGFAHSWCENWTPKSMKQGLDDEHSPNFARVLGTLKNSKEFSKIWNCPSDSKMNIDMKCQLW